jgi:hypothetical protein
MMKPLFNYQTLENKIKKKVKQDNLNKMKQKKP